MKKVSSSGKRSALTLKVAHARMTRTQSAKLVPSCHGHSNGSGMPPLLSMVSSQVRLITKLNTALSSAFRKYCTWPSSVWLPTTAVPMGVEERGAVVAAQ